MPELCRFYGVLIKMYFDDHNPPHFHAVYAGEEALIEIGTLAIISGSLPSRALGLVVEWASQHRPELQEAWDRAKNLEAPGKIDPLP